MKGKHRTATPSPACLYAGSEAGSEDEETTVPSDSAEVDVSDCESSKEGEASNGWDLEVWTTAQLDEEL